SRLAFSTKLRFHVSTTQLNSRHKCPCVLSSASADEFLAANLSRDEGKEGGYIGFEVVENCKRRVISLLSALPGGSWWNLSDSSDAGKTIKTAKPVTVLVALRRIWKLVANDRWVIYAASASLIVAALSEISIPNILAASIFSAQSGEAAMFYKNSLFLLLLCFTSGICSGVRSGCFEMANTILLKHLRETFYSAVIFQDISFFDTEATGDLTSRLGADCQRLSHIIGNDIHLILKNAVQGIGALINLLTLSWPLALSTLVICSVLSTVFLVYASFQKKAAKLIQEYSACANKVAQETFSHVRSVRVYGTEQEELGRYKRWLDKLAFVGIRESAAFGFWHMSFTSLYRSTQVFAVILGGVSILSGHASAEQLMKYVLYCEWLIYAAWRIEDNMSSLVQSFGASEKVFELIDLMPCEQFLSKGTKSHRLVGKIEFVNVSFSYPSRLQAPVLEHVNISVQANEMVAIVGLSGSGKSTLMHLLLRLYEPTNGQILVDGFPIVDLDIRWLREKIGFVGQDSRLFHMDVKSNISYGCLRDIKQEDVEWAAKQAHAHEFITSLPNGYETVVDDGLLSGGQKQQIAIARALIRDPAILVLDEPTSAMDAENEYHITMLLHAFRNDSTGAKRTIIVLSHRLSTVKAADRIIVMDGGRVVEEGSHEQLLHKENGRYAQFIRRTTTDVLD
ncbi:Peptide-transporting ATPase, partial [Bertholletia excelsa]